MSESNFKAFAAFVFVFLAMVVSQRAQAVYVATPSVEGLSGGTYKPLTTPALTGPNFVASGKVLINGKLVNIPGYVPPASTAAQAARSALWLNPWLVGASLLAWAGDAGLGSDQVGGWIWTDPNGGTGPSVQAIFPPDDANKDACRCASRACYCDASMQDCVVNYAPLGVSERYCYAFDNGVKVGVYAGYDGMAGSDSTGALPAGEVPYGSCPSGYSMAAGTTSCKPAAESRPATQADFDALPAPPAAALAELAPQTGVPVDAPVYEPMTVEVGTPYTRPDGSTAQPMATISPAGDGQVWIDTFDQPLTDPSGVPYPSPPPPEDTQEMVASDTQCDKYPHTLGCANLDTPEAETLGTEDRSIALIAPVSIDGAGTCPAPLSTTVGGITITMPFDALCQYATTLRPLVLALAWLSAGVIFIGGVRNA